jgi:hypothetical protein
VLMAQILVELDNYIGEVFSKKDREFVEREKPKICEICGKKVSKGNTGRHAGYHRKCNFCQTFHYLKDLRNGVCPVYNVLLHKFFPSANDLKIKIF